MSKVKPTDFISAWVADTAKFTVVTPSVAVPEPVAFFSSILLSPYERPTLTFLFKN